MAMMNFPQCSGVQEKVVQGHCGKFEMVAAGGQSGAGSTDVGEQSHRAGTLSKEYGLRCSPVAWDLSLCNMRSRAVVATS